LLFVHGWPGSFLEVENIIDRLTNPPNASLPAFHVVAPSIPGFGFSPAPTQDGFGGIASAASFNELMHQLNYTTYVCQGGDIGSFVIRYEAAMFPDSVVSILSNLWVVHPNNTDMERYKAHKTTDGETTYIEGLENFIHASSGYRIEQETLPLTLAYALTDSPSGYSMWIYALMRILIDPRVSQWTPEEIITWSMMYIIQGPYGGLRIYKELQQDGAFIPLQVIGPMPFVKQPTAITQRPYDLGFGMPLEWAQRVGNVVVRYQHAYGGHFAAWQTPESLAQDLWNFFGNEELSGTSVFSHGGSSSK
jgi:pimeloyl-ACP methyl ester carboxylesterase